MILPKYWCVRRTESNYKIINEWFSDNRHGEPWSDDNLITITNSGYETGRDIKDLTNKDTKEITFEEFCEAFNIEIESNFNHNYPIF